MPGPEVLRDPSIPEPMAGPMDVDLSHGDRNAWDGHPGAVAELAGLEPVPGPSAGAGFYLAARALWSSLHAARTDDPESLYVWALRTGVSPEALGSFLSASPTRT